MTGIESAREYRWLASHLLGFRVCNGIRPGGCFLQYEAWEAREMSVESTERLVEKYALSRQVSLYAFVP